MPCRRSTGAPALARAGLTPPLALQQGHGQESGRPPSQGLDHTGEHASAALLEQRARRPGQHGTSRFPASKSRRTGHEGPSRPGEATTGGQRPPEPRGPCPALVQVLGGRGVRGCRGFGRARLRPDHMPCSQPLDLLKGVCDPKPPAAHGPSPLSSAGEAMQTGVRYTA